MTAKCLLQARGYQLVFHLTGFDSRKEYIDMTAEFSTDSDLCDYSIRSKPMYVSAHDLRRLVAYFNHHIADLRKNPDKVSDVFVPMELGFQVQALSGDVWDDDGSFTLRFMVNIGQHDGEARVYVGGEAVIDVKMVRKFAIDLEALLSEITEPKL